MSTLYSVVTRRGETKPQRIRFSPDAIPEAISSQTGMSTRNGQDRIVSTLSCNEENISKFSNMPHCYAMRTTYSRERNAYDNIISNGGSVFLPKLFHEKIFNGKQEIVEVSHLPNIFFVYDTEDEVKEYVYDNIHLPFLRFYHKQRYEGVKIIKEPLIVLDSQIKYLKILCMVEAEDIRIVTDEMVQKFKEGDSVTVIERELKGNEGKVAHWHGQQRVAIIIEGICTKAYIPQSYMEPYKKIVYIGLLLDRNFT